MRIGKLLPAVLFFAVMASSAAPLMAANPVGPNSTSVPANAEDPRAQQLLSRLDEIKDMKKSDLSSTERKSMRKEVKGIREELKQIKGGVYLSVGAILLIILVLILVL